MDGDKISERVVVPIFIQPPPDLKDLYRNEQDLIVAVVVLIFAFV